MTRTQVDSLIAARTGEPLSVIRRLGFQLHVEPPEGSLSEELHLVVHCPFCRHPVPYPGRTADGSATVAGCDGCNVDFEVEDRDVFPTSARRIRPRTRGPRRYIPA